MPKAVRFEEYGDESVLQVVEVPMPSPGEGEVVVRVVTSAINPGEAAIRSGALASRWPATFPEGEGSDLAGVVVAIGERVDPDLLDAQVIGLSDGRNAHAEYAVLPADRVTPKPPGLDWAAAGTLYVAGTTAMAMLDVVDPQPGETLVIAGAAGGVGAFATQLALQGGSEVVAIASERNHAQLRAWGAVPVAYGDGLEERVRAAAPDGVQAFLDTYGGYVPLAVALGVPVQRIETIIMNDQDAIDAGAQRKGMAAVDDPRAAVAELAVLVTTGEVQVPIKGRYPLSAVADAYRDLASRGGLGKIVLDIAPH